MMLPPGASPSLLLNTPGAGVQERTTVAHLVYDTEPRWPGARLVATNGAAMAVIPVKHESGSRVPPGTIGRKALKLVERARRFTGNEKRIEPVEGPNDERLVVMRPAAHVMEPGTIWPQEPADDNVLTVKLDADLLATLAHALGGSIVSIRIDIAARVDGLYEQPVFVRGDNGCEGVMMPIGQSK